MVDYLIIGFTAFFASLLTFFSGFGLGTLLSVAFLQFFPIRLAIIYTSIVHFLNNIFKVLLMRKSIDKKVLWRFGLTAIIGAMLGALVLKSLPDSALIEYSAFGKEYEIRLINLVVSFLLAFFALAELLPILHFKVSHKILPIGGFLSGFFGGLSGHQGALRSSFLIKLGLSKDVFVGTGIAVSMMIDITRIGTYTTMINWKNLGKDFDFILVALIPALAGAICGRLFLKKMTYQSLQIIVAVGILIFSIVLGAGWMQ